MNRVIAFLVGSVVVGFAVFYFEQDQLNPLSVEPLGSSVVHDAAADNDSSTYYILDTSSDGGSHAKNKERISNSRNEDRNNSNGSNSAHSPKVLSFLCTRKAVRDRAGRRTVNVTARQYWKMGCTLDLKDSTQFFHVGKGGGGSVRLSFLSHRLRLLESHPFHEQISALEEGPATTLLFNVRDPVDRFASAFYWANYLFCIDNDGRRPKGPGTPAPHNRPDDVCHGNRTREKIILHELYRRDANNLAMALCEENPLYSEALQDVQQIRHAKFALVDWLDFLIGKDGWSNITSGSFKKFMVLTMEHLPGIPSESPLENDTVIFQISTGESIQNSTEKQFQNSTEKQFQNSTEKQFQNHDTNEGANQTLLFQWHIQQAIREILMDQGFSNNDVKLIFQTKPPTSSKVRNDPKYIHSSSMTPAKHTIPRPLNATSQCCMARYFEQDYRLIRNMLSLSDMDEDHEDIDDLLNVIRPLEHVHPLVRTGCDWGIEEQRKTCRAELRSMIRRRAMFLDRSLGTCEELTSRNDLQ